MCYLIGSAKEQETKDMVQNPTKLAQLYVATSPTPIINVKEVKTHYQ